MFKPINNLNPTFMNKIVLQRRAPYTLRNVNTFIISIMYAMAAPAVVKWGRVRRGRGSGGEARGKI